MRRLLRFFLVGLLLFLTISFSAPENRKLVKIGIIAPSKHQAITELIKIFETTLREIYPYPIQFSNRNAMGDVNLQHTLIEGMETQNIDLFVPIGSSTTHMVLALIHDKPVVSLASDLTKQDQSGFNPCHVTAINDTVSSDIQLRFIQHVIPHLKNLTVIYSYSEINFHLLYRFLRFAKLHHIYVQSLMIEEESDLPGILKQISNKSQLIFIFRDNRIVKHASMIAKEASQLKIPVIASDDGSVKNGAAFGIGFASKDIGRSGAKIAFRVLQGENPCRIPVQLPGKLMVFINPISLKAQTQWSVEDIQLKARQSGYPSLVITPIEKNHQQMFSKI